MKAVIFAGGAGTRMWPVSRKASPKQFETIIGDKSTLQLAVDRLRPEFDWHDIYISTGAEYAQIVRKQIPLLPASNLIAEPEMRDVAAAVGYLLSDDAAWVTGQVLTLDGGLLNAGGRA